MDIDVNRIIRVFIRWACCIVAFLSLCSYEEENLSSSAVRINSLKVDNQTDISSERKIFVYKDYTDMEIFHFTIPDQTVSVVFNFKSDSTESCAARNITIYCQAKTYPVVSPDGSEFSSNFWINRSPIYLASFFSSDSQGLIEISAPLPKDWFLMALIIEDSEEISQAGLGPSCETRLEVEAHYQTLSDIVTLSTAKKEFGGTLSSNQAYDLSQIPYFRFFVPNDVWLVELVLEDAHIENGTYDNILPIRVYLRASALPLEDDPSTIYFECNELSCAKIFTPFEDEWYYVTFISSEEGENAHIAIDVFLIDCLKYSKETHRPMEEIMPYNKEEEEDREAILSNPKFAAEYFSQINSVDSIKSTNHSSWFNNERVHFKFPPMKDQESSSTLTADDHLGTTHCWKRFMLNRKSDSDLFSFAYTLSREEAGRIFIHLKDFEPTILIFELVSGIDMGGTLKVTLDASVNAQDSTSGNYVVIGCLTLGTRGEIEAINGSFTCTKGRTIQVSTSDSDISLRNSAYVPYPEPGKWFLTLHSVCFRLKQSYVIPCHEPIQVVTTISSEACVEGDCGEYGSCYLLSSSSFLYTACVCKADYKGWSCTDDSEAKPEWELILSLVLLTLSNLFFLPAILLAFHRKYYAESFVYGCTFFFSTFYHACDVEVYNFCLLPFSILQFGDFYSANLSFYVTLIAMANLTERYVPPAHMLGALIVAVAVNYNKTSLWTSIVPFMVAFLVMVASWAYHSWKSNVCYPPSSYWLKNFLPGLVFSLVGLICFAFLETEENYYIVHSIWHSTMAVSILFLLPSRNKDILIISSKLKY